MKTTNSQSHLNPSIVSLVIPVLLLIITPIMLFNYLSIGLLVGAGIMLAICITALIQSRVVDIQKSDISMIWVIGIVYSLYLLSKVLY